MRPPVSETQLRWIDEGRIGYLGFDYRIVNDVGRYRSTNPFAFGSLQSLPRNLVVVIFILMKVITENDEEQETPYNEQRNNSLICSRTPSIT